MKHVGTPISIVNKPSTKSRNPLDNKDSDKVKCPEVVQFTKTPQVISNNRGWYFYI